MKILVGLCLTALFLSGCATAQSPVTGFLYSDVQGPVAATAMAAGSLRGEACATSILGVYASGDASIQAARESAGITRITSVDHRSNNLLGIYAKYCTVVHGKGGKGARAKAPAPVPAAAPAAPAAGTELE